MILTFLALTIVNVILQTTRSLCTVKGGKVLAATINALCYGLYTVVIVYTMCELSLAFKAISTAICNFIGVYVVKIIEEKVRKDKLWKVEFSVKKSAAYLWIIDQLKENDISFNYVDAGKYYIFNCYCPTQAESQKVKDSLPSNVKYFVAESKTL